MNIVYFEIEYSLDNKRVQSDMEACWRLIILCCRESQKALWLSQHLKKTEKGAVLWETF